MERTYVLHTLVFLILSVSMTSKGQVINDKLIEEYRWENRLLLVFAPSINNDQFVQIYSALQQNKEELEERDMKVLYLINKGQSSVNGENINQETADAIREKYVVNDIDVSTVLIGKDGGEKMRQRNQFNLQKILHRTDQMPMRRAEMEERRKNNE